MCVGVFIYSLRDIGSIDPGDANPKRNVYGWNVRERVCAAKECNKLWLLEIYIYIYTGKQIAYK